MAQMTFALHVHYQKYNYEEECVPVTSHYICMDCVKTNLQRLEIFLCVRNSVPSHNVHFYLQTKMCCHFVLMQ